MSRAAVLQPLSNWSVICLRPAAQQSAVRRAVQARGARHVALPGLRLAALPATDELRDALACPVAVFTSPAAVIFAARLAPSPPIPLGGEGVEIVFAVGAGTARALARYGIHAISPPPDAMHSEGLLALPEWNRITGPVGLITAPGGRGTIPAGLTQRGLEIRRAEVYQRLPPRLDARHHRALMQSPAPRAVLVSSAEALDGALNALPAACRTHLLDAVAVACSARLADLAQERGFSCAIIAAAPTATAMLDALERSAMDTGSTGFR